MFKFLFSVVVIGFLVGIGYSEAGQEKRYVKKLSKQDWVQVRSKNFEITSNAKVEKIEAIAIQLEEFRYFVSTFFGVQQIDGLPPVRFLVLKDRDSYELLGLNDRIAGIFLASAKGFVSIANGDDFSISQHKATFGRATIMHEMVHYFNHNQVSDIRYPFWYEEGVAEYLSTMTHADGKIVFGNMDALANRFRALLRRTGKCCQSVNVEGLFKYKKGQKGKREKSLYARSFIVVHYLNTSPAMRAKLRYYLALVNAGEKVDQAFNRAFEMSFDDLTEQVDDYLASRKVYARVFKVGKGGLEFPEFRIKKRALSAIEGVYEALDITMHFPNSTNGELNVADTVKAFSDLFPSSDLHLLLNAQYNPRVKISRKMRDLNSFLAANPKHSQALTKLGSLFLSLAAKNRQRGNKVWIKHNSKARKFFLQAIEANEANGLAHYELVARTYEYTPYTDGNIQQAILGLEITRLFSESYYVHKREGLLRLSVGDYTGAERSFNRVVAISDSAWANGYATWVKDNLQIHQLSALTKIVSDKSIEYADGSRYTGAIENEQPHGQGQLVRPNGVAYQGQWQDGLPHGQGQSMASNGMTYKGQFDLGAAHGIGELDYAGRYGKMQKYQGEFFRFAQHGQGKLFYPNKRVASGPWFKGEQHGIQTFAQGKGQPTDILYDWGQARITEQDGTVYWGAIDYRTLKPKGKGKCREPEATYFKTCKR